MRQGETVKFGRVRFRVKKLVVEDRFHRGVGASSSGPIVHSATEEDLPTRIHLQTNPSDISSANIHLRNVPTSVLGTLENEHVPQDLETRFTMNFAKENVSFENKFEFDNTMQPQLKLK